MHNVPFDSAVRENFSFLETDFGFCFTGVREVNHGLRDSGVVARYHRGDLTIQVGWTANEGSLAVLVRLDLEDLRRSERYVYLEPFIEFRSGGAIPPIIPQIYPGMSVREIQDAMTSREQLFESGLENPLKLLATRLREYSRSIFEASAEAVRQYHEWYRARSRAP